MTHYTNLINPITHFSKIENPPKYYHPCLASKPTSVFGLKTQKTHLFCGTHGLTTVQCTQNGYPWIEPFLFSLHFPPSSLKHISLTPRFPFTLLLSSHSNANNRWKNYINLSATKHSCSFGLECNPIH